MEINSFRVCVECITFNHSPYIVDAMNGFIMQETNFPFVCAIIDDASTDGEQEVIKNYLNEHFDLEDNNVVRHEETDDYVLTFARHKTNKNCYFAVLWLKYNHYSIKKNQMLYVEKWQRNARYTALCEGDDYWTDSLKLQKQFDFMEAHPECSLCFHAHNNLLSSGEMQIHQPRVIKQFYNTEDIIIGGGGRFMGTNTMFYFAEIIKYHDLPDFWKNCPIGDTPLTLFLAAKGMVGYIDDVMSVHRIMLPGSWTARQQNVDSRRKHHAAMLKMYDEYDAYTGNKYHKIIKRRKMATKRFMIRKEIAFFIRRILAIIKGK